MEYRPIELKHFQVLTGKSYNGREILPSASIELLVDGVEEKVGGEGRGPVDAMYRAVNKLGVLKDKKPVLQRFEISSSDDGSDAIGTARVGVIENDKLYTGVGKSTDILEAALVAYLEAINNIRKDMYTAQPLK